MKNNWTCENVTNPNFDTRVLKKPQETRTPENDTFQKELIK